MTRFICSLLLVASYQPLVSAQAPESWTSGEIYSEIQKLRVLGSALYVAAHPDDENTRLITYMANDLKVETTYLSVTRGDGGQNLVGPEISELLGVIRTQELLQARRIDHGEQHFTRAVDFGYSKTPEESLEFWNEEDVLSDVVWAIRKFQPDVIINRFSAEPSPWNHGHHVASAMLSVDAYHKAADPDVFPEQLQFVEPWQPRRLFFNTSWWFYGSREAFDSADKSRMVMVDVGSYDPVLAESYPEIAARSRSMHKSQGFGSSGTRGEMIEYLEKIKGDMPSDQSDLFEGIDLTWGRLPGASHLDSLIAEVGHAYDFLRPYKSIEPLLAVRREMLKLPPSIWRDRKLCDIDNILGQMMGLYMEATVSSHMVSLGDSVEISIEAINRSPVDVALVDVSVVPLGIRSGVTQELKHNIAFTDKVRVRIPDDMDLTPPYWLQRPWGLGMYSVPNQKLRGLPETPHALLTSFMVAIGEDTISFTRPVVYRETDPVKGEVYKPFEVVPPVFVNMDREIYLFSGESPRDINVTLKAMTNNLRGVLRMTGPKGYLIEPGSVDIALDKKGSEQVFTFSVKPSQDEEGELAVAVDVNDRVFDYRLTEITYDHIPAQTVLRKSEASAKQIDLKHGVHRIAYIQGAGDDVARSLREVGYTVDELTPDEIATNDLKSYDAIVLGIRAYNTQDRLVFVQDKLFNYVKNGGTVITQYNTTRDVDADRLGPYEISISRLRVTEEDAPVEILHPEHKALKVPNKITGEDFTGWVQERGLYFPDEWDEAFTPLLAMSDKGEAPLTGGLLVAEYGKGHFVYTGLSFFRQLPAGVAGAHRLFANLLALGQNGRS